MFWFGMIIGATKLELAFFLELALSWVSFLTFCVNSTFCNFAYLFWVVIFFIQLPFLQICNILSYSKHISSKVVQTLLDYSESVTFFSD